MPASETPLVDGLFRAEASIADGQGEAAVPATCGELVQGTLDGKPCLVSCPIGWFAVARVRRLQAGRWEVPVTAPKAAAALRAATAMLGTPGCGARLVLEGDIPRGRGYGSSTADVGAAFYAAAAAQGRTLRATQVAAAAVAIEPSDSTLFPGLALFDHRQGRFHQKLGAAPALEVLVIDPGIEVDTVTFNRRDMGAALRRLAAPHRDAFQWLRQGLTRGESAAIGAAATLSARSHQSILYNPLLEGVMRLADEVHALGVCRAHSGSLLGILLDPAQSDAQQVGRYVGSRLEHRAQVVRQRLVDGGPYYRKKGGLPCGEPLAGVL